MIVPIAETNKAICLEAKITVRKRRVRIYNEQIWIPKSQIIDGKVSLWIVSSKHREYTNDFSTKSLKAEVSIELHDADGNKVETILTEAEARRNEEHEAKRNHLFQLGKLKHDALYLKAKQLGIKGVRKDMKTATIEKLLSSII